MLKQGGVYNNFLLVYLWQIAFVRKPHIICTFEIILQPSRAYDHLRDVRERNIEGLSVG